MANNFCIMPFIHTFVTPNLISPCCAYGDKIKLNSKKQYWSSEQLKNIQQNMLNDIRDKGCEICWKKEDRGFSSLRQHSNQIYSQHITQVKNGTKFDYPFYLDLRLGNLCNLKCRMCISEWSSQIADEILSNPNEKWDNIPAQKNIEINDDAWELLEEWIPNVKRIFMTGGEPTIIKRNLDYINKIVETGYAKNIELIFTTNATNVNKKFLEIGKQFNKVHFSVSIDAVNDLANYIRFPSKWSSIRQNLELIGQHDVGVAINTTIQWLNMTRLNEMFEFIEEYITLKPKQFAGVWFQLVTDPNYLDPIYAPKFMKEKAIHDIDNFLNKSKLLQDKKYSSILHGELKQSLTSSKDFLKNNMNNTKYIDSFLKNMGILDRIRNQTLFTVLPELKQLGG